MLTRGKLSAPAGVTEGIERAETVLSLAAQGPVPRIAAVPCWVGAFFHLTTLEEALRFAAVARDTGEDFLLACLLGILHHQRPGFLSYPSSHLGVVTK